MKIYKKSRLWMILAYFVWSWSSFMASATWWLLNVPTPNSDQQTRNSKGARAYCNSLKYLTDKQKSMCIHSPTIMSKISHGVIAGMRECQLQFQHRRWNCTPYQSNNPKTHAFEPVLKNKGPERAYIKAMLSAAVSYKITRACSGGELPLECMCANIKRPAKDDPEDPKKKFEWGGCSDDVNFGDSRSREFFDESDLSRNQGRVLDIHNNEAGRKSVKMSNRTTCKCHGLTGACTQNICWRSLPPLRRIGKELFQRYNSAVRVKTRKLDIQGKATSNDLVYVRKSPSFCIKNNRGSYGTAKRWCNRTSTETEGCAHMCCGRGYRTEEKIKITECNCEFQWCCNLNCYFCEENVEESYCK